MKTIYILCILMLVSCRSETKIEIEIISDHINSLNVKKSEYGPKYIKSDTVAIDKSRTLLTYMVTNRSDKTFYFNIKGYQKLRLEPNQININNAFLNVYDKEDNPVLVRAAQPSLAFIKEEVYSKYLNYDYLLDFKRDNFVIHPNEILYFEWFIVLPFGNLLEDTNYSIVLDENKEYFAKISLGSTSDLKYISRTDLRIIRENNYEIFDGIITSKNEIPIKINNLNN